MASLLQLIVSYYFPSTGTEHLTQISPCQPLAKSSGTSGPRRKDWAINYFWIQKLLLKPSCVKSTDFHHQSQNEHSNLVSKMWKINNSGHKNTPPTRWSWTIHARWNTEPEEYRAYGTMVLSYISYYSLWYYLKPVSFSQLSPQTPF